MSMHHSFDIEHARLFGLEEAVFISNLQFWVSKNAANNINQHDGRTWTYNSAKAFTLLFPYLSPSRIRRTIDSLENQNVVLKGNYSPSACDRTLWLAFVNESAFLTIQKPAPISSNGAPKSAKGKSKPAPISSNGCADFGKSLIGTDINTDVNLFSVAPTALPTTVEILPVIKAKKAGKSKADDAQDTALQAACRATWAAYSAAYCARYGVEPLRNAKVNSNVKDFVKRIGHDESPGVARFYVDRVGEAFVIRGYHALGTLLQNAEAYRTQWATGQAMTNTRAQQADKTQSNFDAVAEAMAIRAAKRGSQNAE